MSNVLPLITSIIATGEKILIIPELVTEADGNAYIKELDGYLGLVDKLQQTLKEGTPEGITPELAKKVISTHAEVTTRTENEKEEVRRKLTGLYHRSVALRGYLDRLPGRISITGKRKG